MVKVKLRDDYREYEAGITAGEIAKSISMGLYKAVEEMGAFVDTTAVGDRYVLERMLQTGCVIGGEQSQWYLLSRLSVESHEECPVVHQAGI